MLMNMTCYGGARRPSPLQALRTEEGEAGQPVRVDDMLTKFLRAHQREGLQFLFDCVTGLKPYEGQGWCDGRTFCLMAWQCQR